MKLNPLPTNIALGFIAVPANSHLGPLHQSHDPPKVLLVDDPSVVIEGLGIVGIKLLR